jgi:hypothetical protein
MSPQPNLTHRQERMLLKFFVPSIKQNPTWPVIISEGDSWFSFPLHANTIDWLDAMAASKISLLRLEKSGDGLLEIFNSKQKEKLRKYLKRYPVEALLFSGGGNDIAGKDLLPLLKDKKPGMGWEDCIHKGRVKRRLDQLKLAYLDLVDIRNDYRKSCVIYVHGYDYAIPDGKKANVIPGISAGPWLKPHFDAKGITNLQDSTKIIRWLIDRFNDMLIDLAKKNSDFIHIQTRKTLTKNEWNDELHPSRIGFEKVAKKFRFQLKKQFPGTF